MLDVGGRVTVDWSLWDVHGRLLCIRIRNGEPNLSRDLAGVRAPSPEVERPGPLLAPGVLLHVVDGTFLAQHLLINLQAPCV